ncbi:DUF2523 family protein [Comamonas sp. NoAH]|uniref:DUF2523 family protein n=1 Tax=Comamonas halotolerans TaxID=3041496 RepID=UPI0024E10B89|nr:DUF2523 family protein [Comamonas sp. NoAH]
MKLGTFLLSLVEPIAGRILMALGMTVVSFIGFTAAFDQLKSQMISSVNRIPAPALELFLLAGGGEAISIIVAAIAFRVVLWQAMNAKKIIGANPS